MQKSKGFVSAVMFVMTLAMVACASTRTQKSAGEQVDDTVTTAEVKAALIADPTTKAHQIDVETFKGTVQLNGFVDSAASKERASEVARKQKGVTAVRNNPVTALMHLRFRIYELRFEGKVSSRRLLRRIHL